jgi:hypothetical protein
MIGKIVGVRGGVVGWRGPCAYPARGDGSAKQPTSEQGKHQAPPPPLAALYLYAQPRFSVSKWHPTQFPNVSMKALMTYLISHSA